PTARRASSLPPRTQPRMRLVLLTGEGAEHRYLADALAAAFPDELRAIVVARPPRTSPLAGIRRYLRRYSIKQLASRVRARLYARRTGAAARRMAVYSRLLYPGGDPGRVQREDLIRVVPGHNSPECLALLSEIGPDVVAVYGTAVIREPVMRLARRGVINMHTGISPRYRGADTIFWALHNEEPEWVGATIHLLDAGIDSGPIIRTVRPEITPEDDEDSLFCKTVVVGS